MKKIFTVLALFCALGIRRLDGARAGQGRRRACCRSGRGHRGAGRRGAVRDGSHAEQGRRRVDAHVHRARHHDEHPGARALLRRHGASEEHALGADAGVRHVLADRGALVHLRLQPRVHGGQRVLRELRSAVPVGHVRSDQGRLRDGCDVQQRRRAARARVRRVPGDVRGHHLLPDRRRVRRAHEVLGRARVHGDLVHVRLPADRAHGLVLARSGCLHRSEARRRAQREGRLAVADGARSTSRAARSCTSTPASRAWSAPTWSASASASAAKR